MSTHARPEPNIISGERRGKKTCMESTIFFGRIINDLCLLVFQVCYCLWQEGNRGSDYDATFISAINIISKNIFRYAIPEQTAEPQKGLQGGSSSSAWDIILMMLGVKQTTFCAIMTTDVSSPKNPHDRPSMYLKNVFAFI